MEYFEKFATLLENITGLNTSSGTNMNRSKTKVCYAGFWVFIYGYELVHHLTKVSGGHVHFSVTLTLILLVHLWVLFMFYRSFVRGRSMHIVRVTLQTAKLQLVEAGVEIVPSKSMDLVLLASVVIVNLLNLLMMIFSSLISGYITKLPTLYLSTFHFNLTLLAISLGYLNLKCSCKIIYQSINKTLEDLQIPEDINKKGGKRKRKRETPANRDYIKLIGVIKKVKTAIINAENEVNAHFFITILWNLIQLEFLCPRLLCGIVYKSMLSLIEDLILPMACFAFLLLFVYTSIDGASNKELSAMMLKQFHTCRNEDHHTFLRRYLQSTIHFGDVETCVFFDLEYSMVMDMLDYGILIFTVICLK